jgi:hypothetical protein
LNECIFTHQEEFPLKRLGFAFFFAVCAALLSSIAALAQQSLTAPAGPVPPAILAAKKIFLSNSGASSALYSGGPNRAYNQFYAALQTAGVFEMVADPSDADLILEIQIAEFGAGQANFRLVIYDRKSHFVLWTVLEPIRFCNRQKTCDGNFDDALPALLLNFEKLAGKGPIATQ